MWKEDNQNRASGMLLVLIKVLPGGRPKVPKREDRMIDANDMARAFARNTQVLKDQCDGLTNDESLLLLPFRGNCMNWVLGHIAVHRARVLDLLGATPLPIPDPTIYDRKSEQLDPQSPSVLQLQDLLMSLDSYEQRISAALTGATEEQLAEIGRKVFFLYFHETYHVGQTELLRQLAGKNDKVI
jgi:hypothetical protein